jgi:hypothetical protein
MDECETILERTATLHGTILNLSFKALVRSHYGQLQTGGWDTVVGVAAGYSLDGWGPNPVRGQHPSGSKRLSSALMSIPALGPTQLRAHWVPRILPGGKTARG